MGCFGEIAFDKPTTTCGLKCPRLNRAEQGGGKG